MLTSISTRQFGYRDRNLLTLDALLLRRAASAWESGLAAISHVLNRTTSNYYKRISAVRLRSARFKLTRSEISA